MVWLQMYEFMLKFSGLGANCDFILKGSLLGIYDLPKNILYYSSWGLGPTALILDENKDLTSCGFLIYD